MNLVIVTTCINPPIPIRKFDWAAWVDGYEEDGKYGYGNTKWEAIRALIDRLEDEEE